MMASKPRNISSSPTNLSPSRVQTLRNSHASGRSSGTNGGSKKGPSSPMSTGTAGRTPQTRRKELSVPQQQNSPLGSPKNQNSTVTSKKTSLSTNSNSRKNSLNGNGNNSVGSSNTRSSTSSSTNRRLNRGRGLSTTSSKESEKNHEKIVKSNREETKFDGLWDVKSVKDGLVRLPTKCLDELVTKDSIDKYYEVEDTPVAR